MLSHLATIANDLISHNAKASTEVQMMLPDSARKGKLQTVQFLIESVGVDVNFCGRQDMTALHFGARGGKAEVVKWMLNSCPTIDVNKADRAGKTPLEYATANGKDDIIALLNDFAAKQT